MKLKDRSLLFALNPIWEFFLWALIVGVLNSRNVASYWMKPYYFIIVEILSKYRQLLHSIKYTTF